jgi:hypothetical protein
VHLEHVFRWHILCHLRKTILSTPSLERHGLGTRLVLSNTVGFLFHELPLEQLNGGSTPGLGEREQSLGLGSPEWKCDLLNFFALSV